MADGRYIAVTGDGVRNSIWKTYEGAKIWADLLTPADHEKGIYIEFDCTIMSGESTCIPAASYGEWRKKIARYRNMRK